MSSCSANPNPSPNPSPSPNLNPNLLLWPGILLLNAPALLAASPVSGGRLRRWLRLGAASLSPLFMLALFSGQANGKVP